ncbi:hypothetical protein RB599_010129 [Gaeumannomyces hyphopodioides]
MSTRWTGALPTGAPATRSGRRPSISDAYTDIPTFGSHRNPRDHFHSQVLRFLLSGKGDIAQSILEFHQHFIDTESKFVPLDKEDGRRQGGCSPAWSADGFEPGISAEFRFLRSPLKSMESRIQDYIRQSPRPNPLTQPIQILLVQLLNRLEARKWRNAAISDGARRIEWTCKCGRKIFDDYETFHPEGASVVFPLLEKNLKTYPSVATSLSSESSEGSGATTAAQTRNLSITSFFRGLAVSLTSLKGPALPQHNNTSPADPARLGVCPQPAETDPRRGTHTFLLLCLPFMRTAIKLLQLETCTIYSDREFFRALAYHYSASRGRTSWARLRKVRSLKFVEFEVFQSELVNIRQCPSLPPESLRMSEYTYQPALAVPPIGSNLLTHLFENPDHAEVLPVLFQRIPRKLRSRLTACQRKGSAVGWGIQVDEGLNWVGLLVWGSVGFFVCLAIALGWTLARDDAQGGFAIASFVLTFLVFCGGLAHAEMASW